MQEEMNKKIKRLIEDKEYMKHLLSLESVEEISKELEKVDVNLSLEDLKKIYALTKKMKSSELTDAELEEVAGGFGILDGLRLKQE